MKTCFKCGKRKRRSSFYAHPRMGDGLLGKCKVCTKKDARAVRVARLEYYKEYDRRRGRTEKRKAANRIRGRNSRVERPDVTRERTRNYRLKYPLKYKAHTTVHNAIRDGKLKRQPCERCGSKAQAHHADYAKPLEVRWLCEAHHKELHRKYA